MTFARAKPGGWVSGERLTHTQANAMDVNIEKALDGGAGGDYNPSGFLRVEDSKLIAGYMLADNYGWLNVDAAGVADEQPRTRYLSVEKIYPSSSSAVYTVVSPGEVTLASNSTDYYFELPPLPLSAKITGVAVMVQPGAARATAGNRMSVWMRALSVNSFSTPTAPTNTSLGTATTDDGTANLQIITHLTSVSIANNDLSNTRAFSLRVTSGNDAATNNDSVRAIRILWNDPGLFFT